jgi:hypothetical protein
MIPEIEGGGVGYPQIRADETKLKGVRKKYGYGQCSKVSAHKDERHAVRISRSALAQALLLS